MIQYSRNKVTKMTIALALVASLWMAIAQPLDPIQYTALMDVYDGLGSFLSHTRPP
jgi:hypothetical protein